MTNFRLLLSPLLCAFAACSSGGGPPDEPGPGQIKVNTSTTGTEIDPDGYTLLLDGQVSIGLPVTGSGTVSDLPPGSATVDLTNVMGNCSVAQPRSRTLTVQADATTETDYIITCVATTGTLNVFIESTGLDLDLYMSYSIDGSPPASAAQHFDMAFTLGVGQHTFEVTDVAPNCVDPNGLSRAVAIRPDSTTYVRYDFVCEDVP